MKGTHRIEAQQEEATEIADEEIVDEHAECEAAKQTMGLRKPNTELRRRVFE